MAAQSVLVPLLSFVGGLAGGVFGQYISKRGEIRAVHAELAKVVQQNSAITKATEEIRASISREVWKRDLKKEACYELLKQLQPIGETLPLLMASHLQGDSESILRAQQNFVTAYGRYLNAEIVVEMVGSKQLQEARRKMTATIMQIHHQIETKQASDAITTFAPFANANETFMNACRRELGFEEETC